MAQAASPSPCSPDARVNKEAAAAYLREKVDPLLSDLVQGLLVEQPDDVLAHIGSWLRRKRVEAMDAARNAAAAAAAANDTSSSSSSSSSPVNHEDRPVVAAEDRPATPPGGRSRRSWREEEQDSKPKEKRVMNFSGKLGGGGGSGSTEGGSDGTEPAKPMTDAERREARLKAIEARSQGSSGSSGRGVTIDPEKRKEIALENKRQAMVGKVRAMYAAAGVDEPFGLGAATMETLERHYRAASGMAGKRAEVGHREGLMRNAVKLG